MMLIVRYWYLPEKDDTHFVEFRGTKEEFEIWYGYLIDFPTHIEVSQLSQQTVLFDQEEL